MSEPRSYRSARTIPEAVDFERIATIYQLMPSQIYAGGAYSLLIAYVMWGSVSSTVVIGWLVYRLALCAVRIRESHVFARDAERMQHAKRWRMRFRVLMLLEPPSWSFIALVFVPHVTGDVATFLYASVLIVPAVALFSLMSHFPTAAVFVVEIITPLVVKPLFTFAGNAEFVAGGLCIYGALLVYEAWRSDARWVELACLRFESDSVARAGERARELAEESSRAKSAFLANMSHEIRTPLNGMMGLTALLLRGDLSAEQRSYLELSQTSSEHLLKLVEQVLDMSKINAGGVTLDEAPYNPHALADEVLQTFAAQAAHSGISLRCRVASSVPQSVIGDAMRLRQVLTNLVGNAVKFTDHGHITLSMVPVREPQPADGSVQLSVAVSDSGPGIAADKQALVFQAFTQADASTTRDYGGTGLGLTISAALVSRMGGELALDSTVGVGSRFHFELTQALQPLNAGDASRAVRDLKHLSVLWVDADDESREWHTAVLETWNVRVIAVAHVSQALERADRGERFRVVCVNRVAMSGAPDVQGVAAYRAMVDAHGRRGSRVVEIGTTAGASPAQRSETALWLERLPAPPSLQALGALLQRAADDVANPQTAAPAALHRRFTPPLSRSVTTTANVSPLPAIRVLLAEDNDINALIATRMLQHLGADVTRAVTGAQVLALMAEHTFDLVFMDVQMPVMDGYDATQQLRARERQLAASEGRESDEREGIPVIALTANVLPTDRAHCEAVGMTDYLAKPIVAADLAAMYARYTGKQAPAAALLHASGSKP